MSNFLSSLERRLSGRSYQYSTILDPEVPNDPTQHLKHGRGPLGEPRRKPAVMVIFVALMILLSIATIAHRYATYLPKSTMDLGTYTWLRRSNSVHGCEIFGNCEPSPQVWGQYSPFFSVPSEIDDTVPAGCEVTFAQILSRHGARDPTARKSDLYRSIIDRIQQTVSEYGTGFDFIKEYNFTLGKDQLTWFGKQQMFDSGVAFYSRYKSLAQKSDPFIRASGSERVVLSAKNFTQGLYKVQGKDAEEKIEGILVIPEGDNINNTMNHGLCPEFEDGSVSEVGRDKQNIWKKLWVPQIMRRLEKKLPGMNFTLEETIYMMDMCPFDTVADDDGKPSPFCRLFSPDEWQSYDYFYTLDKWYGFGPGNPLGPTQGVGYVNELIARLTGQPVVDDTTTNKTLDSSPDTFPLDKSLYADFSHDNDMVSVYGAMGLYSDTENLPVEYKIPTEETGGFSAAWTVSFAGRMYVEKMRCGSNTEDDKELVRVIVNDRVVPLQNCEADNMGRCRLDAFVESLSFARSGGLWNKCFT